MNTKQINGGNTPKGGKDNTRVVLTAAGAVAVGTAAGVAGTTLFGDDGKIHDSEEEKENQGEEQAQNEQQNDPNSEQQSNLVQARQENQSQQQTQPQQASNSQASNGGAATGTNSGSTTDDNVEAEALAVAERLVQTDEIDAHDIEELANVNFEESDILYMENGTEVPVAAVTTPDGGQYLLADVDGDRIYDVVYDTEGNLVAGVQAGLNTNDAQLALEDEGGYLPITDDDPVFNDEDVDVDIFALDDSDNGIEDVLEEIDEDLADLFSDEDDDSDTEDESELDIAMEVEDADLEEDLMDI